MATEQHGRALRLITSSQVDSAPQIYSLSTVQEMVLGRSPDCQVLIDSQRYTRVSRRHAVVRPINDRHPHNNPTWQICDLGSANGTFVNGQRIYQCQSLQIGDLIVLGQNGPHFIFEDHINPNHPPKDPPPQVTHPTPWQDIPQPSSPLNSELSVSQLLPIVSARKDLLKKGYLIPGILTVVLVVSLFVTAQEPNVFNTLLAFYLGGGAFFFIYRLCGKTKPLWVLGSSAILTMILLVTPILRLFILVFRVILPGNTPDNNAGFIPQLISNFFGAGLMEELLKALPVLFFLWLGTRFRSPKREQIGIREPLDGILLAAASALGFTWLETLGQYVPNIMNEVAQQSGEAAGDLVGLQLLIPRILGSVAGHMAYSGYFGYFIGLSVLKPAKRWRILGVGYLTASLLHAFWNASAVGLRNQFGPFVGVTGLMIVGVISYAFLMAAILKARQLSPTRSKNFATRVIPPS